MPNSGGSGGIIRIALQFLRMVRSRGQSAPPATNSTVDKP